jgi:steroid Delta-isomerase
MVHEIAAPIAVPIVFFHCGQSGQAVTEDSIRALKHYFETLTLDAVPRLAEYYAANAYFKDPFNEVRGIDQIEKIFRHMFATLDAPQFVIQEYWTNESSAVFLWEFQFRFRGKAVAKQSFTGMSLLRFDAYNKINHHRDYWDAAEEIYEKVPLIGSTLRWMKRRMN